MRTTIAQLPLALINAVSTRDLGRALARAVLLGWLLGASVMAFQPPPDLKEWTGQGDGRHWSDPRNWLGILRPGPPQNGDSLVFGVCCLFGDTPDSMVNDLPGLSIHSMDFSSEEDDVFSTQWFLDGNDLTITGEIQGGGGFADTDIHINCGITFAGANPVGSSPPIIIRSWNAGDQLTTLRFNGPLDINRQNLIISNAQGRAVFQFNSAIIGRGAAPQGVIPDTITLVNAASGGSASASFSGSSANTFDGTLTVHRLPGARPWKVSFDKLGGVVKDRLMIGDGCEVELRQAHQIGNDASVGITGGGRLLLNGHTEILGSLLMTNVHADAESTLVDATGTTLFLRGDITTSVFNEGGKLPTIKGQLDLSPNNHIFNLQNLLPGPGLDIQGEISGEGGFQKFGNAGLVLERRNRFGGRVEVHEGNLELGHAEALGPPEFGVVPTEGGLVIGDGTVTLRNVVINKFEPLVVRGTRHITGNSVGSLLTCLGEGGWLGRIQLDADLVINSTDLCRIGGPITGFGGFEFLGSRHQMVGSGSATNPSHYVGVSHVLCELLIVNMQPAHLIVGGGFSPQCEVRWERFGPDPGVGFSPDVTIHTNGLVQLNGRNASFETLIFHGGRIVTGTNGISVDRVITHPTNVTASIDGFLQMTSSPTTEFRVAEGPAAPDLVINARVIDTLGFAGIEKTGGGDMVLVRSNAFGGRSFVREGTLSLGNNHALGATFSGTTVAAGATVAFGKQADTVLESFTISGAGVGGTSGALFSSADVWINTDMVLEGPAAIRTEGTNSRVQVNNVSGMGPLTKLGRGRFVLRGNGNNTYSGDTLVNEGILDLAKPDNITSIPGHLIIGTGALLRPARVEHRASFTIAGSVTVNRGLWDLQGNAEDFGIPQLQGRPPLTLLNGGGVQTGAGIVHLPVGGDVVVSPGFLGSSQISGRIGLGPGNHRFVVGSGSGLFGADCTVNAVISQNSTIAGIEKAGPGTLVLSGANIYAGDTIVSGGRLQVEGTQPQSLVQVNAGALQGAGTVGPVLMTANSAIVAPRSSPSILTSGSLSAGPTGAGILQFQLNGPGDHDQLNVRGTVDLSRITLSPSLNFASALNDQFIILLNDGADPVIGTFNGLPQNGLFVISGKHFRINYTAGDGNDVALTHLPPLDSSAHIWVNDLGGNWHNPTNWSTQTVPDIASVGFTNSAPIAAITNFGVYTITNDLNVAITELFYNNGFGTLSGNGNLDIRGPFIWEAGSLAGSGTINVEGGMHITGAANLVEKQFRSKTLLNKGAATWAGNGTISFSNGAILSNAAGATFDSAGDGTLNNGPGSNLVLNAGKFRKTGGSGVTRINVPFHNSGEVEVQSGTLSLNNGGTNTSTISAPPGATLELGGGHTFTSDSTLAGGGNLLVNGTTINLAGSINLSGSHTFNGGTVNITGDYHSVGNTLTLSHGTVRLNGTGTIAPAALNLGGFSALDGASSVTVNGPMAWSGSSHIRGSGTITATDGLHISGNVALEGKTLVNQAAATWNSGRAESFALRNAVLINEAGATFDCTGFGAMTSSETNRFINRGLFHKGGDTNEIRIDPFFDNTGAVEIESGTLQFLGGGTSAGNVKVAAGATLSLGGGTWRLPAGADLVGDGDLRVSGGAANLAGLIDLRGVHIFSGGIANITGDYSCRSNVVKIIGGTANFNGTGTIAPAELTVGLFGTLGGSQPVTVSGPMTLLPGSTLSGNNSVIANGGLSMVGNIILNGRTLVNAGAALWSNNAVNVPSVLTLIGGAVLHNAPGAVFDFASACQIQGSTDTNAILNGGLIRQTAAGSISTVNVPFINTGTVELRSATLNFPKGGFTQNGGTTTLRGGSITTTPPLRINGGILQGSGVISGSVINGGTVRPGGLRPGTLRRLSSPEGPRGEIIVTGDYTQTADGVLNIEIGRAGPATGPDLLIVSNKAILGGTLNIMLTDGLYPAANSSFSFLIASNQSGTFATINYPSNEIAMALTPSSSNLAFRVINTKPVIPPIPTQSVTNGSTLRLAVNATDEDLPAQTLSYALETPPRGATIDPSGVIIWTPFEAATPLTRTITVLVTDNGSPSLTSSRTFQLVVADAGPGPLISLQRGTPGTHSMMVVLAGRPNTPYLTQYTTNLPGPWIDLATNLAGPNGILFLVDTNTTNLARFYRTSLPR